MANKIPKLRSLADRARSEQLSIQKTFVQRNNQITIQYGNIRADLLQKINHGSDNLFRRRNERQQFLATKRREFLDKTNGVLNDKALEFLVKMSDIDAPTLTSIFAGYELARKSDADQKKKELGYLERSLETADKIDTDKTNNDIKVIDSQLKTNESELKKELSASEDYNKRVQEISEQTLEDSSRSILQEQKADDALNLAQEKQTLKDESSSGKDTGSASSVNETLLSMLESQGDQKQDISSQEIDKNNIIQQQSESDQAQDSSDNGQPSAQNGFDNEVITELQKDFFTQKESDTKLNEDGLVLQSDVIDAISSIEFPGDENRYVSPVVVQESLKSSGLSDKAIAGLTVDEVNSVFRDNLISQQEDDESKKDDIKTGGSF